MGIKRILKTKAAKKIIGMVIAALLIALGFGEEIAKEFSKEASTIVVEDVLE
jgi:hypothetical protein